MVTQLWAIGLVLVSAVLTALGPIFLKRSTKGGFSFRPKKIVKNKNLIKGGLIYLTAAFIFIPALKGGEVSILYPIASTTHIWVCLFSTALLKEKMNLIKWAGILLIILGVIFVSIGISG
jgi:uncharacterized membrane protein